MSWGRPYSQTHILSILCCLVLITICWGTKCLSTTVYDLSIDTVYWSITRYHSSGGNLTGKKGSDRSWTQDLRSNLSARLPFHTCIGTGVVGKGHRIETATLPSNATPAIVIGCDPQHVPVTGAAAWNCLRPVSQGSVAFPLSCDVMQHSSCKLTSTQRFAD